MKRTLTTLALCAAVLAVTACTSGEEPAHAASPAVVGEPQDMAGASDASDAADTSKEGDGASAAGAAEAADENAGGSAPGSCTDLAAMPAVIDVVTSAGVDLALDESSGDTLDCTWATEDPTGPLVFISASATVPGSGLTTEMLTSVGQQVVEDPRFDETGAIPTVVGCETGDATYPADCAIAVYGAEGGMDVDAQAHLAAVTPEQLVEVAWAVTESYHLADHG